MKKFLHSKLIRLFYKSFLWLLIPIDLFLIPIMQETKSEAIAMLTPYSVQVEGYYRSDGTYVHPYNRRPPGSVDHDLPFEKTEKRMFWGIFGLVTITTISLLLFSINALNEVRNVERNYLIYAEKEILAKMKFDFSELSDKPDHLINRLISRYNTSKVYSCIYCRRAISYNEFHYSSLASNKPSKICINCMLKSAQYYNTELNYIDKFNHTLGVFIEDFRETNLNNYPDLLIEIDYVKQVFYNHVKLNRSPRYS